MSSILDEIEEGIDVSSPQADTNEQAPLTTTEDNAEDLLGLDKPIKLKTRAKLAKIDNQRIFSPNGLPYIVKNHGKLLRTIQKNDKKFYSNSRTKISRNQKFEHEYDNLSSVLQFYQLWCHGLFPKANFKDCIHMIRSLSSKSPQVRLYRRELIDIELRKLKVAKGIIIDEPISNEDNQVEQEPVPELQQEQEQSSNTIPSNDINSLFVDSNSNEDFGAVDTLFVGTETTESQPNDPTPDINDKDHDSDDPFSDNDDIVLTHNQQPPKAATTTTVDYPEEELEVDLEEENMDWELMKEMGS
ncbi:CSM3 Chromosome segregation in meiosis protein 3 [Candida maltosa Xu316]|uniref:Chromosome segregation in meiosis protein n=1 Tax=Candida maltosa (strain Xu316) TaxID=1245528 RepID=M3IVQ2_CANMX|nr:hypothetical protein G210_1547 [Candida maltosa Xu316]